MPGAFATSIPTSPVLPPLALPGPSSLSPDLHIHNPIDASPDGAMKEKSHLDIVLDNPQGHIFLKGTGANVEPARLSGHVYLFLTEATALKEIALQFRGKAKIPMPANESLMNNSAYITYTICTHDWSFLEGDKKHSRTLKPGRHFFPFSLSVDGSLPSSIHTPLLGGASISYKLRALATRPGLAHNLTSTIPVHILRSLTPEALEYQQSLEIENTWPEKLMYAIVLPHKAWAAGDTLVAVLKFSPMRKGVRVSSVVSTLYETVRVYARSGNQEETRVVASVNHEMPVATAPEGSSSSEDGIDDGFEDKDVVTYVTLPIPHTSCESPSPSPLSHPTTPLASNPAPSSQTHTQSESHTPAPCNPVSHTITMTNTTPTHALEPIAVSHRVRWAIFIHNADGHTSELRCSLPVHILDGRVLEEARGCSVMTRQMVLGAVGLARACGELGLSTGVPGDTEAQTDTENAVEDRELPSYPAHVRDRIANMFLPEGVMVRAPSPWVGRIGETGPASVESGDSASTDTAASSVIAVDLAEPVGGSGPHSRASGSATPAGLPSSMSNLPHAPNAGASAPEMSTLDWVNTELLLSLSDAPLRGAHAPASISTTTTGRHRGSGHASRIGSRWGSREQSRVHSRSGSPGPGPESQRRSLEAQSSSGSGEGDVPALRNPSIPEHQQNIDAASSTTSISHASSSLHIAHHGHSVRSLFKATMKPFAAFAHGHGKHHPHGVATVTISEHEPETTAGANSSHSHSLFSLSISSLSVSRGSSHQQQLPYLPSSLAHSASDNPQPSHPSSSVSMPTQSGPTPLTGEDLMHRAFTSVPDYSIAARGFIGGVPPLSSMQGLPSYEEAQAGRASSRLSRRRSSGLDNVDDQSRRGRSRSREPRSRSTERRATVSDSGLVGPFGLNAEGISQRLGSGESGEDDSDEGIQTRPSLFRT
ncbi:unnamed protein product [Cyclocybe aegerita]|uniref:Arrestin C-terminal-like domain-containing protein n=1 Tax=Cyclocybe aegerita TaxID=1973307 RepID=A0A8S0WRW9_CYCAE|nr:unnamed protein product [Cyclocybe aegerita]